MIFHVTIDEDGQTQSTMVDDANGVVVDVFDDLMIILSKEFIDYHASDKQD